MAIDYRFVPWAQRGLSRAIATPDAPGIAARPAISVSLTLKADRNGADAPDVQGDVALRLFGPADVLGIDTRLILRTDPKPQASGFEPNYLALVDFDPPDFPWMFTPAKADANQRLRPWLVLLVFERSRVALPRLRSGAPLPSVVVDAAVAPQELPDLAESALWAHAQATSSAATPEALAGELLNEPQKNVSRLLSPRRLSPSTAYVACLVPAFELGRRAGLGLPLTDAPDSPLQLHPAWAAPFADAVTLPVYFHWEFATGPAGDFETLARRIKTPHAYVGDADLQARLDTLGTAPMLVDADRLLTDDALPVTPRYEGALTSLTYASPAQPAPDVGRRLQAIVNAPQNLLMQPLGRERVPTVAPPLYGAWHARQHLVSATPGRWLNDLNRDPRFRAAAGQGTEVVRANQEPFMDACWGQVGEVLRTERALAQAALSRQVLRVLQGRLAQLPDDRLLAVAGPAASRIRLNASETVRARIRATSLPDAVADPALRRLTSAQRPVLKAAVRQARGAPVAQQVAAMVATLVKASAHPEAIDPNRHVPDGLLGTRSLDALAVPDDPRALVDLAAVGLPGQIRADALRALQTGSRTAHSWFAAHGANSRHWKPTLTPQRGQGVLTEQHFVRFTQLALAATLPVPVAEIARQMHASGAVGQSEGVLVGMSDVQGQAVATLVPLRIDGRTGAIQAIGAGLRLGARSADGVAPRLAADGSPLAANAPLAPVRLRASGLSFGTVVRAQVGQFGNSAVFGTLPVNTLPLAAAGQPVPIASATGSALAGLFNGRGQAVLPPGTATITVPAPLRDKATLQRFSAAVRDINRLWRSPLDDAGVALKAIDFPLASVATALRRRTDPALTVPARLAATLRIGGSPLALDPATRTLSNPYVAFSLPSAGLLADVRFVVPRLFDRVMAYPRLEAPMSGHLARMDPEAMMPGANAIPNDFLVLAKTNQRFIEAFMVGLNHEMARELLWRGYPTDQRGSPMRHFWDRFDGRADIRELHTWSPALALGQQPPPQPDAVPGDKLVLVVRATLIRRYPNLSIYAQKKHATLPRLAVPKDFNPEPALDTLIQRPIFAGPLPPDLVYVGFDIAGTPEAARDWCFVLEEQMTEPRFGFDEPDSRRARGAPGSWKDVLWTDVTAPGDGNFLTLARLRRAAPAAVAATAVPANAHAAQVARAALQRPFRAYYLGADLVP